MHSDLELRFDVDLTRCDASRRTSSRMLRRLDHPLKTVLQEKSDETASTERSRDR
jgi:hypothetical protein